MIEQAVANNTFEKMREREASGEFLKYKKTHKKDRPRRRDQKDPDTFKFRRGKVGGYVDYLSDEDIAYCDEVLSRNRYFDKVGEDKVVVNLPRKLATHSEWSNESSGGAGMYRP